MQWDEKELDTHFTPNVYFWTPTSEILAKALSRDQIQYMPVYGKVVWDVEQCFTGSFYVTCLLESILGTRNSFVFIPLPVMLASYTFLKSTPISTVESPT